jgi:hypothetical protein
VGSIPEVVFNGVPAIITELNTQKIAACFEKFSKQGPVGVIGRNNSRVYFGQFQNFRLAVDHDELHNKLVSSLAKL